jgi:TRAP-type C4-dicarboxylate transport system permease small subunit
MSNIGGYAGAIFIFLMVALIVVAVFFRRVLNSPVLFSDEISGYLLLGSIFLGLSYTFLTGGHVRVDDIVLNKFSGKAKVVLEMLFTLLAILYTFVFLTGHFLLLKQFYLRHTISTIYFQLPLIIPGVVLILGSLLLVFQLLVHLFSLGKEDP